MVVGRRMQEGNPRIGSWHERNGGCVTQKLIKPSTVEMMKCILDVLVIAVTTTAAIVILHGRLVIRAPVLVEPLVQ